MWNHTIFIIIFLIISPNSAHSSLLQMTGFHNPVGRKSGPLCVSSLFVHLSTEAQLVWLYILFVVNDEIILFMDIQIWILYDFHNLKI